MDRRGNAGLAPEPTDCCREQIQLRRTAALEIGQKARPGSERQREEVGTKPRRIVVAERRSRLHG